MAVVIIGYFGLDNNNIWIVDLVINIKDVGELFLFLVIIEIKRLIGLGECIVLEEKMR